MQRKVDYEQPTAEDLLVITKQIGRKPRGVRGIVSRCPYGYPQVILNRGVVPAGDGKRKVEIFPTLFWLTCPALMKAVSRIEDQEGVRELQDRVNKSPQLKRRLKRAHRVYARLRWDLLTDEERKLLQQLSPKAIKVMKESGIGGIRGEGLKCLHTHLADFLAGGENPVGARVWDRIESDLDRMECAVCQQGKDVKHSEE